VLSTVAMMNHANANAAMLRAQQQHPAAMAAAAASMAVALGQFPGAHHGHHMTMLHGGNMLRPPPMGLPPGKCNLHTYYNTGFGIRSFSVEISLLARFSNGG
jgi:hypothetical protein